MIKNNKWIYKGLLLGISFFLAILLTKPIGVSTQFSVLSGIFHAALDETLIVQDNTRDSGYASSNAYYDKSDGKLAKSISEPWNYDFVFVLFIPVGAYIAFKSKRKKAKHDSSEHYIAKTTLKERLKIYAPSFLGGFLLLFGARMAGGCTSGHMMSGIMQGSISGYVFALSVFAIAIPIAIIMAKQGKGVE